MQGGRSWSTPAPLSMCDELLPVVRLPAPGCSGPSHTAQQLLYIGPPPSPPNCHGELWGRKGSDRALWGEGDEVSGGSPGGGRQRLGAINDWVSQHQHSQHAV